MMEMEVDGGKIGTKPTLAVEVCVADDVVVDDEVIERGVRASLERQPLERAQGYPVVNLNEEVAKYVRFVNIVPNCEVSFPIFPGIDAVAFDIFVYRLEQFECASEVDEAGELYFFHNIQLPHRSLEGLWESLVVEPETKISLLNYALTMTLFTRAGVDPLVVNWNRVVLLHGPPGTGKTSLCKALAQKLSIRLSKFYSSHILVEINAHSLFSKWFSESGKLVMKMFRSLRNLMEEEDTFVYVLIDEIESLTAVRSKAMHSAEPSDALRVVNAVLTELDRLKAIPNTMVFTTSNLTRAIDEAFMDRADVIKYIGHPSHRSRYEILRQCIEELQRCGLIECNADVETISDWDEKLKNLNSCSELLRKITTDAEGFSGRALRKMPFIVSSTFYSQPIPIRLTDYLKSLLEFVRRNEERP